MAEFETIGELMKAVWLDGANMLIEYGYNRFGPHFDKPRIKEILGEPRIIAPTHWEGSSVRTAAKSELYTGSFKDGRLFFLTGLGEQNFKNGSLFVGFDNSLNRLLIQENNFGLQGMADLFHFGGIVRSPVGLNGATDFACASGEEIGMVSENEPMFLTMAGFENCNYSLDIRKKRFAPGRFLNEYHAKIYPSMTHAYSPSDEQYFTFLSEK